MKDKHYELADLLRIMERLRDPDHGCPWDQAQDFKSIVPSTLEECYELAAAIEAEDYAHLEDELGDVLFQVIFYAQLGAERALFDFSSVVQVLCEKLLRRHPHVFADGLIEGVVNASIESDEVKTQWEAIKASERQHKALHGVLDDVPVALPALPRAQKLQKRAARVGFDWSEIAPVLAKLDEEIVELKAAVDAGNHASMEDELGDVLFTTVNMARHLKVDAESALRRSSSKFEARFRAMEAVAADRGESLSALDDEQLDTLWNAAKAVQNST